MDQTFIGGLFNKPYDSVTYAIVAILWLVSGYTIRCVIKVRPKIIGRVMKSFVSHLIWTDLMCSLLLLTSSSLSPPVIVTLNSTAELFPGPTEDESRRNPNKTPTVALELMSRVV